MSEKAKSIKKLAENWNYKDAIEIASKTIKELKDKRKKTVKKEEIDSYTKQINNLENHLEDMKYMKKFLDNVHKK